MKAFFSSLAGGICTDPEGFVLPVDDHGFHRGHAVFDTANVEGGRCYALEAHLDRLCNSASRARLPLPASRSQLKETILQTIAASGVKDSGGVRFWLTAGRGDFQVTPAKCEGGSSFFAVVLQGDPLPAPGMRAPCAEVTTTQELKGQLLATIKTTNYLLNALVGAPPGAVFEAGFLGHDKTACGLLLMNTDSRLLTPLPDGLQRWRRRTVGATTVCSWTTAATSARAPSATWASCSDAPTAAASWPARRSAAS